MQKLIIATSFMLGLTVAMFYLLVYNLKVTDARMERDSQEMVYKQMERARTICKNDTIEFYATTNYVRTICR